MKTEVSDKIKVWNIFIEEKQRRTRFEIDIEKYESRKLDEEINNKYQITYMRRVLI